MTSKTDDPMAQSWEPDQYSLIDFGAGRKLERFGEVILDRPSPAAEGITAVDSKVWNSAHGIVLEDGTIRAYQKIPQNWSVKHAAVTFQLKVTPFGHVGVFPEQSAHWLWLNRMVDAFPVSQPCRVLNLFAYTGGSTLASAAAGASVVHVDASTPAVEWGRVNASLSGLASSPVRWIVEDARKFVQREVRRGNKYDLIVLDPPSFGHGPTGKRWSIDADLFPLLDSVAMLYDSSRTNALLLTGHSERPDTNEIVAELKRSFANFQFQTGRSTIESAFHRRLDCGFYIRAVAKRD